MSEHVRSQKWLVLSFFLVCGLVFVTFIYVIMSGSTDRAYSNWMTPARSDPETQPKDVDITADSRIVLIKDRVIELDNVLMTYRGLSSGVLYLDVVLLDLDPHYVYHRQLTVEEAGNGFQVSGRRFKITSVNRRQLKLLLISPSL